MLLCSIFSDFADETPLYRGAVIFSLVALGVLIVATVVVFLLLQKRNSAAFTTRELSIGSVCLAMGFALSFFGYSLAYGGTLTPAATLPVMIYCYYFGFRKGIVVTTAYMLLQFLQGPTIVHPFSAVLDYVIPYMALICLSFFGVKKLDSKMLGGEYSLKNNLSFFWQNHKRFLLGACVYTLIRYISHFLSGIIFYAEWKWDGWSATGYSLAYNSYAIIDAAIAVIGGVFLLSSKSLNRFMAVSTDTLQNANAAKEND